MDRTSAATVGGERPTRRRWWAVGWALGFSVLTSVGLGALAWGLVVVHALVYGVSEVFGPRTVEAVDLPRHDLALVVGVVTNLVVAGSLAWFAAKTPARTWPPVVQGLVAAPLAVLAGASVQLMVLGINPIDFLLSFLD